jgi:hypothetical protein
VAAGQDERLRRRDLAVLVQAEPVYLQRRHDDLEGGAGRVGLVHRLVERRVERPPGVGAEGVDRRLAVLARRDRVGIDGRRRGHHLDRPGLHVHEHGGGAPVRAVLQDLEGLLLRLGVDGGVDVGTARLLADELVEPGLHVVLLVPAEQQAVEGALDAEGLAARHEDTGDRPEGVRIGRILAPVVLAALSADLVGVGEHLAARRDLAPVDPEDALELPGVLRVLLQRARLASLPVVQVDHQQHEQRDDGDAGPAQRLVHVHGDPNIPTETDRIL